MAKTTTNINVTSYGFDARGRMYPRRIEWCGDIYHLTAHGLWLTIRSREHLIRSVVCSDGQRDFQLQCANGAWRLITAA